MTVATQLFQTQACRTGLILYRPGFSPHEIPVEKPSITIGRTDAQDIQINDLGISRQHVEIFSDADGWYVSDCNSSNGTWLDGTRLEAHKPYRWNPTVPLYLGRMMLRLSIKYAAILKPKKSSALRASRVKKEEAAEEMTLNAWRLGSNLTLSITNNTILPEKYKISVNNAKGLEVVGQCWDIEIAAGLESWVPYELAASRRLSLWRREGVTQFVVTAESGGSQSLDIHC